MLIAKENTFLNEVYLHLGSNKNEPLKQILAAYAKIEEQIGQIAKFSQFYKTAAWGKEDQEDFINTAIFIKTSLEAKELLSAVLKIETELGRERQEKWGPRIIDIDILFFNQDIIQNSNLVIPHPRMTERNFVLIPLMEIAADYVHPQLNINVEDLYLNSRDDKHVILLWLSKTEIPYNYISIEGNIGTGKTSFCKAMQIEHNCKLVLETFNDNPFLPLFYKDPQRYAFTVELFFMTERHKQLQNHLLSQDLFYDFTMSDYYFSKTLLFAKNNLEEEEYRLFQKLYNVLNQTFPKPDLLVYFHRNVDVLMENIKKRNRDFEKGITREYLIQIQNSYFEYFRNILSFPVVILDLGDIDFVNNPKAFHEVKTILTKKHNPGVHRMTLVM